MKKTAQNLANISISITDWPAAGTVSFCVAALVGLAAYIVNKLINNGYEITTKNGFICITKPENRPQDAETTPKKVVTKVIA